MTAWVDGAFVGDSAVPRAKAAAPGPFETMGARRGDMPLWPLHLARLTASAARLGLGVAANTKPWAADTKLRAAAVELLLHNGHTDDVLRLSLVPDGAPHGATVHTVLTSRLRGPALRCVRLLPTVIEPPRAAPAGTGPPGTAQLRDLKLWPRPYYDAVLQQAQDGGANDGIVVGRDGAVYETATGNLWLRLAGTWVTPPLDGHVLPGIARSLLLAAAGRSGLPVAERRCDLSDLHRAEALAHSNAVWGPRPAALPGAEPGVQFVDSELLPLWRAAASD